MDVANTSTAKAEVVQEIDAWMQAVKSANSDAIMSHYAVDVVAFDAIQQLQFRGSHAYRTHWEACLAMCPGPMVFQHDELDVQVSGDLATAHGLIRCGIEDDAGGANASWMRMTSTFKKQDGKWLIIHEHFSAPFDMQTGRALFDLDPAGGSKVRPIPLGMSAVTPHLVCDNAAEAIEFYKKAFGATDEGKVAAPNGKLAHACIRIGGSAVFLVDEVPEWNCLSPKSLKGSPVSVHLYVMNADSAMKQAEEAGAKVIMPVQETFWGDRYGLAEDPYGHRWSIATHVRDLSPEEIQKGAQEMMDAQSNCANSKTDV